LGRSAPGFFSASRFELVKFKQNGNLIASASGTGGQTTGGNYENNFA
jgi:hypothetical protein